MPISIRTFPKRELEEYSDVRDDIRSGDLLLCSGTSLFSTMIQKATGSVWSHVAVVLRLEVVDRVMLLESVESIGVRMVPFSHYIRDYDGDGNGAGYPGGLLLARHSEFKSISQDGLTKMTRFAMDRLGSRHDTAEIARIAARIGGELFGISAGKIKRDNVYLCSEYVWECYKSIGIHIESDSRGFIAPKDFARDPHVRALAALRVEE